MAYVRHPISSPTARRPTLARVGTKPMLSSGGEVRLARKCVRNTRSGVATSPQTSDPHAGGTIPFGMAASMRIARYAAYQKGAKKGRCRVHIVGGATISGAPVVEPSIGKRNVLAARALLWRNGVLVEKEVVGGSAARNVSLDLSDGSLQLSGAQVGTAVL